MNEVKRDYGQLGQPGREGEHTEDFFPNWPEIQSKYPSLLGTFELAGEGEEYLREGLRRGFPELLSNKEEDRPRKFFLSEIKKNMGDDRELQEKIELLSFGSHSDIPAVIFDQLKVMVGKKIEKNVRVTYQGVEYCVLEAVVFPPHPAHYELINEIGRTMTEEEIDKIEVLHMVPVKNIADTNI